jgi:hypothetical protein
MQQQPCKIPNHAGELYSQDFYLKEYLGFDTYLKIYQPQSCCTVKANLLDSTRPQIQQQMIL